MARYIDADALIEEMQECKYANPCNDFQRGVNASVDILSTGVKHMPTANVAPKSEVAREIIDEFSKLVTKYVKDRDLYLAVFKNAIANAEEELKKKYTEGKNDGVGEG